MTRYGWNIRVLKLFFLVLPIALQGAPAAMADVTVPASDGTGVIADSGGNSLDEIVVTAQRRSADLSKTPIAISVLSSDTLTKAQITSESDLQAAVPGLTVRETSNSNQLNYSIRGQSLDAFSSSQPGVLPYVNEVQVGGAGGSTAFYDLQSIQVLKGPQGTLFGRNATGGAVLFTTAKPTDEIGGYVDARLGDYDLKQFEGALNVPLVADRLLARIAAFYEKQNGFQRNFYDGSTLGDVDRYGIRASLTARIGDEFESNFVGEYFHSGGNSLAAVLYSTNTHGIVPSLFLTSLVPPPPGAPVGGLAAFLPLQQLRGPFNADVNGSNGHLADNLELSDVSSLNLAEDTKIRNVLGFNALRSVDYTDSDGSPYGLIDNGPLGSTDGSAFPGQGNKTREISDELQIIGKTLAENLAYVAGLYFEDEKVDQTAVSDSFDLPPIAPGSATEHAALLHNKTEALYGEGTYDLGGVTGIQGLAITAGGRYSVEKHSVQFLPRDSGYDVPDSPTYQKYQENTDHQTSWHFGIQEQINADWLAYITTRKSFRDGGFNWLYGPEVGLGAVGGDRYLPETAKDVEIGAKFQGAIADLPTRFDLAVYSMTIDNVQRVAYVTVDGTISAITVNVPQAKVQGFDLDGQINPTNWLKVGSAVSYADARFSDNSAFVQGNPNPIPFGPYPDTARWSGSLYSEVTFHLQADLALAIHGELYDQTGTYFTSTFSTVNPGTSIPGYAIANFRVGLDQAKQGWTLSANVKNAFNRVYYAGGVGAGNLIETNAVIPGAPRTFSADIRYHF